MDEACSTGLMCLRCGHKWMPRTPTTPKVCPKCKRYSWQSPPKTEVV